MAIATITSKGQVTIPKRVREHLDVASGDKLEFRVGDDGSVSVIPITTSVESAFGAFSHKAKRPVSTAESKKRVAEALRNRHTAAK